MRFHHVVVIASLSLLGAVGFVSARVEAQKTTAKIVGVSEVNGVKKMRLNVQRADREEEVWCEQCPTLPTYCDTLGDPEERYQIGVRYTTCTSASGGPNEIWSYEEWRFQCPDHGRLIYGEKNLQFYSYGAVACGSETPMGIVPK